MRDEKWTTRDGRKIAVGDMGEEHVRNTLRMIVRNAACRAEENGILASLATVLEGVRQAAEGPIDAARDQLREIVRANREKKVRLVMARAFDMFPGDDDDGQDALNAQYREDLWNPSAFFPLLEGGVHGSQALYGRYAGKI